MLVLDLLYKAVCRNPFTAMLAVLSLGKSARELPNLKSFWLFHPFARACERNSIKMCNIKSRFTEPSNILLASMYVCTFQLGHFTGWGSEGVNTTIIMPKSALPNCTYKTSKQKCMPRFNYNTDQSLVSMSLSQLYISKVQFSSGFVDCHCSKGSKRFNFINLKF